jgi:hypothetical protein
VTLDEDYLPMIARAPQQDFVVRTLAKRTAGELPLMSGDLVIAGRATRERHPLAATYPLHFRKTYYPGQLRGDTLNEFKRHTRVSEILGIAPPIGCTGDTFRSCLVPGRPFDQITPFGSEPEESNIKHADKLSLAEAAGLWLLAERIMSSLTRLHQAGLSHGDAELHNVIVCNAPLDVVPIDFDMAVEQSEVSDEAWRERCARDLEPLLKVAVFLQCNLGAQSGPLAELSLAHMDTLFKRSDVFRQAIDARAALFTHL